MRPVLLWNICALLLCVWVEGIVGEGLLIASTDGRVATGLVCGNKNLLTWLCLDFQSDQGVIWDEEYLGLVGSTEFPCMLGNTPSSYVVIKWTVGAPKHDPFCVGTLPMGKHSFIWNHYISVYMNIPRMRFLDSPAEITKIEDEALSSSGGWKSAQTVLLGSNYTQLGITLCGSDTTVLMFTGDDSHLDTNVYYCPEEDKTGLEPWAWWVDATPKSDNVLGTRELGRCRAYYKPSETFAMKCNHPQSPVAPSQSLYFTAVVAAISSVSYMYPLRSMKKWLLLFFGLALSVMTLVFQHYSVCRVVAYTGQSLVFLLLAVMMGLLFGDSSMRHASVSATAGLCMHATLSTHPAYCDSVIAMTVELAKCIAVSGALSSKSRAKWFRILLILFQCSYTFRFLLGCELTMDYSVFIRTIMALVITAGATIAGVTLAGLSLWAHKDVYASDILTPKAFADPNLEAAQGAVAAAGVRNTHVAVIQ